MSRVNPGRAGRLPTSSGKNRAGAGRVRRTGVSATWTTGGETTKPAERGAISSLGPPSPPNPSPPPSALAPRGPTRARPRTRSASRTVRDLGIEPGRRVDRLEGAGAQDRGPFIPALTARRDRRPADSRGSQGRADASTFRGLTPSPGASGTPAVRAWALCRRGPRTSGTPVPCRSWGIARGTGLSRVAVALRGPGLGAPVPGDPIWAVTAPTMSGWRHGSRMSYRNAV